MLSTVFGPWPPGSCDGGATPGPTILTGNNFYALPTEGVVEGSLAELPYGVYRWSGTAWELQATRDYPVEATAADDLFLIDTFRLDNNFLLVPEA